MCAARGSRLSVVPLTLALANVSVVAHHPHHDRVVGNRFSLGVVDEAGLLCGMAVRRWPLL
jgi:hypothetical protein